MDCTGHGVLGALMSIIGYQLLNQVVIRKGVTEPADILQELDTSVDKALFGHKGEGVSDVMDLILYRIDHIKKTGLFLRCSSSIVPRFRFRFRRVPRKPEPNWQLHNPASWPEV